MKLLLIYFIVGYAFSCEVHSHQNHNHNHSIYYWPQSKNKFKEVDPKIDLKDKKDKNKKGIETILEVESYK